MHTAGNAMAIRAFPQKQYLRHDNLTQKNDSSIAQWSS